MTRTTTCVLAGPAAALTHTGNGRVTGTEVGDEVIYYEIEVTLDSGQQVDVQRDRTLILVSRADDGEDK